jgi:dTDP-4-amino-4,6-dideoxygalactose transaminase
MNIQFNKPFLTGKETAYIEDAVSSGKISGDGIYTKRCHQFFEQTYGFQKCLLTTSCTDALEMAAILIDTKPGDEIILPSYTFVSTANAFVLRGAQLVFADSEKLNPNIDPALLEELITPKTKAIVVVHYAGIACDLDSISSICKKHHLFLIEDAAQAIDSYHHDVPLGSIGDLAAFSFHETKNIICGEGGMLAINNPRFNERAEVIREKGTNRSKFFRGEIDKYGWVDLGSSFLPSEIVAAFLFAQLEKLQEIQERRKAIWTRYFEALKPLTEKNVGLPWIPDYATNNAHMFYLVCNSFDERSGLITALKKVGVLTVFHYLSLHKSEYYMNKHDGRELPESDRYADLLLRLPLFFTLTTGEQDFIINQILNFYDQ